MTELIDTHAHLNDEKFADDLVETLARAKAAGVGCILNLGDTMESSRRVVQLAAEYDELFAGVGIHPEEAREMSSGDDDRIAVWAKAPGVVAIGEIGLDYYWEKDSDKRLLQQRVFIHQLDLARQLGLPVCVHDREAHGDTLAILKKEGRGVRGVLHCFSGSLEFAREAVKLGWFIGVDGPLTFKNAAKLPEIVRQLPLEHILIETDSPYMAPVPMRGKRNEPAYVRYVAEMLAKLREEPFEKIASVTNQNAEELYKMKK